MLHHLVAAVACNLWKNMYLASIQHAMKHAITYGFTEQCRAGHRLMHGAACYGTKLDQLPHWVIHT